MLLERNFKNVKAILRTVRNSVPKEKPFHSISIGSLDWVREGSELHPETLQ